MKKIFIIILFTLFFKSSYADINNDQWKDSKKTYKDLIELGYDIKAYDATSLKTDNGISILIFVTVLKKEKNVYECQEYQTLDGSMNTLDMSLICKELTQPYQRGIGT